VVGIAALPYGDAAQPLMPVTPDYILCEKEVVDEFIQVCAAT